MMAPALRGTNALAAAAASTVGAVMLSAISFSSTSEPALEQAALQRYAGVVDERRDRRVARKTVLDLRQIGASCEIRRQHLDAATGRRAQLSAIACILAASLATRMRSCPRWASLSA